jgi:aminoglycoside phosphotransferase (APT) family kinase protein
MSTTERSGTGEAGGNAEIEDIIRARVSDRAQEWFPEVGQSPAVQIDILSRRPSCSLFVVRLGSDPGAPRVLAKARSASPGRDTAARAAAGTVRRPTLGIGSLTAFEQTAAEFRALQSIRALFGGDHPAFGAVRALDWLAAEATILMDYVDAGTLRQRVMGELRVRRPWASAGPPDPRPWQRAGEWLRAFQGSATTPSLPTRQSTRDEVTERFAAYHDYLAAQLGPRALGDVARRGEALAAAVLPERLPLAVGHGDYAPRNMFVADDGRVTVFDPLPRWMVPRYEDLCRFMVSLRLLGVQVHTRGAAIDQRRIEEHERQALAGYLADDHGCLAEVRAYQLLILLDKWSALVAASQPGRSLNSRVRRASLRSASGYLRGQAQRLLELAASAG